MPRQQSPAQRATVNRVMHEFKHGELNRGRGGKVKNPRQAVAIALSEAGASKFQSKSENRRRLSRTKRKESTGQTAQAEKEGRGSARRTLQAGARTSSRRTSRGRGGEKTRQELYKQAVRRKIPGRSRMNKAELERALRDG